MNIILNHFWPGNIRELINTLTRTLLWTGGPRIEANDMRLAILENPVPETASDWFLNRPFAEDFSLEILIDELKKHYLERAMTESMGRVTLAAEMLGMKNYQTLNNWLKQYGLK